MMKHMSFCSVLALLTATSNADDLQAFPPAFQTLLLEQQCDTFDGFDQLAWEKNATPYRFGILENAPERDSAAVWCHWREGKTPKLLLWSADASHIYPCGNQAHSTRLNPGEITVRVDPRGESGYQYLDGIDTSLAEPLQPEGPSFSFSYEGLSTRLACHKGRWVFVNFD